MSLNNFKTTFTILAILAATAGALFIFPQVKAQDMSLSSPSIKGIAEKYGEGVAIKLGWTIEPAGYCGFKVEKSAAGAQKELIALLDPPNFDENADPASGGLYVDPDVSEGITYTYYVSSYNLEGIESNPGKITIQAVAGNAVNFDPNSIANAVGEIDYHNNSVILKPTRFSFAGIDPNENLTAVGGVNYEISCKSGGYDAGNNSQEVVEVDSSLFKWYNLPGYYYQQLASRLNPSNYYKSSGVTPDNGAQSIITLKNIPPGSCTLLLTKDQYESQKIDFQIADNQSMILSRKSTAMRPRKGAPPPSFSSTSLATMTKDATYEASDSSGNYIYFENAPWYGWQPIDAPLTEEPKFDEKLSGLPLISK